jgi:hypothetical protein
MRAFSIVSLIEALLDGVALELTSVVKKSAMNINMRARKPK